MNLKEKSYNRAYEEIMDYMINYCSSTRYDESDKKYAGVGGAFVSCSSRNGPQPKKGDLIRLGSAFNKEFRLSWYEDERRHYYKDEFGNDEPDRYETEWLLKSIKTGNLCWWSNVSLCFFERKELEERYNWKWNDRQFEFKDKWWDVCFNDKDAYITLPVIPRFYENYEVTLGTRIRFGGMGNDFTPTKTFPDYRKLTKKMLGDFYDECVELGKKRNG